MAVTVLDINIDKTELVLKTIEGKKAKSLNLTYDKIERIQFGSGEQSFLFMKKSFETVEIKARGREQVLQIRSDKVKGFENIKEMMQKFASDNRVTIGR